MAAIAIIDDNPDQSETAKTNLELELEKIPSNLKVITSFPFHDRNEYFNFIEANDVCVLILDEQLNDQSFDDSGPVDYKGSELVASLRERLKELPIFALTVRPEVQELKVAYPLYEDIMKRTDFIEKSHEFVPKIWRAAKNYLKENTEAFSRFNEVTKKISEGDNSQDLIKEMQALQAQLDIRFSGFEDRSKWLEEYDKKIIELGEFNELLKSKMKK